jgi:hypothetical protein
MPSCDALDGDRSVLAGRASVGKAWRGSVRVFHIRQRSADLDRLGSRMRSKSLVVGTMQTAPIRVSFAVSGLSISPTVMKTQFKI